MAFRTFVFFQFAFLRLFCLFITGIYEPYANYIVLMYEAIVFAKCGK